MITTRIKNYEYCYLRKQNWICRETR